MIKIPEKIVDELFWLTGKEPENVGNDVVYKQNRICADIIIDCDKGKPASIPKIQQLLLAEKRIIQHDLDCSRTNRSTQIIRYYDYNRIVNGATVVDGVSSEGDSSDFFHNRLAIVQEGERLMSELVSGSRPATDADISTIQAVIANIANSVYGENSYQPAVKNFSEKGHEYLQKASYHHKNN